MSEEDKSKMSIFWSIFNIVITNLILIIPIFINPLAYWWMSIVAIIILDALFVGLISYGKMKYEKVKDKGKDVTTFSRKMFNFF